MCWSSQFPDYDSDLPDLPGFNDESWGNDACPVIRSADGFELWCDYADRAKREHDDTTRYELTRLYADDVESLASSDDLETIKMTILAHRFADNLRRDLTADEWHEMRRRNVTAGHGICASHDFLDANMTMHEAWIATFGDEPSITKESATDAEKEADSAFWSRAWDIAKAERLTERDSDILDSEDADSLDPFIRVYCAAHGIECDGDVFGMAFSGKRWLPTSEARRIIEEFSALYCLRGEPATLAKREAVAADPSATTVDLKMTWQGALPILLALLESGTDEGKRLSRSELERMAKIADSASGKESSNDHG